MVLRFLLRYLANNERLIQALSDSYPMRKAARFVAGLFIRSKNYQERALENLRKTNNQSDMGANKSQVSQFLNDRIQKLKRMLENERK